MIELKPCPFCGETDTLVAINFNEMYGYEKGEDAYHQDPRYTIVCSRMRGGCGATGGYKKDAELAIENWNTRPNNWISVEERLPDTTTVLGCNIEGFVATVLYMSNAKRWVITTNMSVIMDVTHWQPLPEPPKGSE